MEAPAGEYSKTAVGAEARGSRECVGILDDEFARSGSAFGGAFERRWPSSQSSGLGNPQGDLSVEGEGEDEDEPSDGGAIVSATVG